jgi:polysaccharide export outer membrane protein
METNKKIFLVDDNLFTTEIYAQHLIRKGFQDIERYEDGYACLAQIESRPDIVFLDHQMPGLTGLEVLKKIRRFDPSIFVVFLSGQEDLGTAVESLKYGAFDYIIKDQAALERMDDVLERIERTEAYLLTQKRPWLSKFLGLFL